MHPNQPDSITIEEDKPIVRVVVIGGACTPPGFVMLEAEPYEEFYRRGDFIRCTAPLRFKQGDLWGFHARYDQWADNVDAKIAGDGYEPIPAGMIKRYPGIENHKVKQHYREVPLMGMSCAVFEIPASKRVIITGGSESLPWPSDGGGPDNHYSFRMFRVTVADHAGA